MKTGIFKIRVLGFVLALELVTSCSKHKAPIQDKPLPSVNTETQANPAEETVLFDAKGHLLASKETVAWLTLPRGLRRSLQDSQRAVFYADKVTLEKLEYYFASRVVTGEIKRMGQAVAFRGARPRQNTLSSDGTVLDVAIFPVVGAKASVKIDILPPAVLTQTNADSSAYLEQLKQQRKLAR